MSKLDMNKILNSNLTKVLVREFENLKHDYSKLNVLKYKELYENAPLIDILNNSRYIFSEPLKGYDFYKSILESAVIPFNMIENECLKIDKYFHENKDMMSIDQKNMYEELLKYANNKMNSMENTIHMYEYMTESPNIEIYNILYEYTKNKNLSIYDHIDRLMEEKNIFDIIQVCLALEDCEIDLYSYLNQYYTEKSDLFEIDYKNISFLENVLNRMNKDSYFKEKFSSIKNVNLRHLIQGLSNTTILDNIETITEKKEEFNPRFSTSKNAVNKLFEDSDYDEVFNESNNSEKLHRLICERAAVKQDLAFLICDEMTYDKNKNPGCHNKLIEKLCIESTTISKIPQNYSGQIEILENYIESLDTQIHKIQEKYFNPDGSPSLVISQSIGKTGKDSNMDKKTREEEESNIEYGYLQKKDDRHNIEDDSDEESDVTDEELKRRNAKKRRDDKYSNMNIDDMDNIEESTNNKNTKVNAIGEPEKPNVFRRIQNKALDANVKFKKKVAEGQRKSQDARNAGKAVAKIPLNITGAVKHQIDEWDEMDDNKRKEYILKPGVRKRYFRALKLCITHYVAFAINPILNIVLFISRSLGKEKDARIKNELLRELQTEIDVTKQKIEDAKSNGDQQQVYKLMRIQAKLEAELIRVGANAKTV